MVACDAYGLGKATEKEFLKLLDPFKSKSNLWGAIYAYPSKWQIVKKHIEKTGCKEIMIMNNFFPEIIIEKIK